MRALIASIVAELNEELTQYAVFYGEPAATVTYPYVMLWSGLGGLNRESLGCVDLSDRLGVTMVATTPEGVLAMVPKVRAVLVGFQPTSDSWHVQPLQGPYDSQDPQKDRDAEHPRVGYPWFGVDLYRLHGERT